jgi:hypothetical protein
MDKEFLRKIEHEEKAAEEKSRQLEELLLFEQSLRLYAEQARSGQSCGSPRSSLNENKEIFDACDIRTNFQFAKKAVVKALNKQKKKAESIFKCALTHLSKL